MPLYDPPYREPWASETTSMPETENDLKRRGFIDGKEGRPAQSRSPFYAYGHRLGSEVRSTGKVLVLAPTEEEKAAMERTPRRRLRRMIQLGHAGSDRATEQDRQGSAT
jgi:hypothetical protein